MLLWATSPRWIPWSLSEAAAARGWPDTRVRVERPGVGRWIWREISVADGRIARASRLAVSYSLPGLLRGELLALELDGLRLRAEWSSAGLRLGDEDASFALEPGSGAAGEEPRSGASALEGIARWVRRAGRVRVRDARLSVHGSSSPITAALDARLDPGGLRGRARIDVAGEGLAIRAAFGPGRHSSPRSAVAADGAAPSFRPPAGPAWWGGLADWLPVSGRLDVAWDPSADARAAAASPSPAARGGVRAHFDLRLDPDALTLSSRAGSEVELDRASLATLGRAAPVLLRLDPWLDRLGGELSLRISRSRASALRARLSRGADGAPELALESGVTVETPGVSLEAPLRGRVFGTLGFGASGLSRSDLRARVEPMEAGDLLRLAGRLAGQDGAPVAAEGILPPIDLVLRRKESAEALALDARLAGADLDFPGLEARVRGLDARAELVLGEALGLDGRFEFDEGASLRRPAAWAAASGEGRFGLAEDLLSVDVALDQPENDAAVAVAFRRRLGSAEGELKAELSPFALPGDAAMLEGFSPLVASVLSHASGEVAGAVGLRWPGPHRALDLRLSDARFEVGELQLAGVSGELRVAEPFDPVAAPQRLAFERGTLGVEVSEGALAWTPLSSDSLRIDRLQWRMLGGAASLAGEIDLSEEEQRLPVQLDQIRLGQAVDVLGIEYLTARGRLSGELPMAVVGESVRVRSGSLRARKGRLRYRPPIAPAGLQAGSGVDVALDVLDNFHFEDLEIDLDGALDGILQVGIRLRGSNPDYYDGHPVDLNLDLEVPAGSLLRSYLMSLRLPEAIEEKLSDR